MPKTVLQKNICPEKCVGENIRLLIIIRGMSRKEFIRRMNITDSTLSNWINGKTIVPMTRMFRAGEVLKIEPYKLAMPNEVMKENCIRFPA